MRFLDAIDGGRFGLDAIAIAPDLAPEIEARLERIGCPFVRCSEAIDHNRHGLLSSKAPQNFSRGQAADALWRYTVRI